MAKNKKLIKFAEFAPARIFDCQLIAIGYCDSRASLIAVYSSILNSISSPFLRAMLITAIRERQAEINGE